jgi:DnaJ-class molecular chaperone
MEKCKICDGLGWYGQLVHSNLPWEAEQVQCRDCLGTGYENNAQQEPLKEIIIENLPCVRT